MVKLMTFLSWVFLSNMGRIAFAAFLVVFSGILLNFYNWPVYTLGIGGAYLVGIFFVGVYYAISSMFKK